MITRTNHGAVITIEDAPVRKPKLIIWGGNHKSIKRYAWDNGLHHTEYRAVTNVLAIYSLTDSPIVILPGVNFTRSDLQRLKDHGCTFEIKEP